MKKITFFIICWLSLPQFMLAELDERPLGARAAGMGEAFSAVADDASAARYNPAGLAEIRSTELLASNEQIMPSLTDESKIGSTSLIFAQPIHSQKESVFAFGYQSFRGANYFNETMFRSNFAQKVPVVIGNKNTWVDVGVGVNYFSHRYESNSYLQNSLDDSGVASGEADPYFSRNGLSTSRVSMDIGALCHVGTNSNQTIGLSMSNLLQKTLSSDSDGEHGAHQIRLGWSLRTASLLLSSEMRRIKKLSGSADYEGAFGLESKIKISRDGMLQLRGGYGQGTRDYRCLSTGLSVGWKTIRMDYAFVLPMKNTENFGGQHTMALSFNFDGPEKTGSMKSPPLVSVSPVPVVLSEFQKSQWEYKGRKAAGASIQERLSLLQGIINQFGPNDWAIEELSSL